MGRTLLYWWPDDGWQRGTVSRLCPRGAFSHVVAYTRQTSALRGTVDTLLDAASYGTLTSFNETSSKADICVGDMEHTHQGTLLRLQPPHPAIPP